MFQQQAKNPVPHTDIRPGWMERLLPAAWHPYARLARLDRPIGTWLLLFPCWWSIVLATGGRIDFYLFALFGIGAIVMRGAGCTVNDILDRDLDKKVERTRVRPLPSGQVTLKQALWFLAGELAVGLLILIQLNLTAIILGVVSLILVGTYPLMKRVTWWPQAYLGLTFNWGALMGWAAVTGAIGVPALILYAAGILWTLGYDTIYAHQDKEDDARIGIKSTALKLGKNSRYWIAAFYTVMSALLALAGHLVHLGIGFYLGLMVAMAHLAWQVWFWIPQSAQDSLSKFRASRWTGWIILVALWLG